MLVVKHLFLGFRSFIVFGAAINEYEQNHLSTTLTTAVCIHRQSEHFFSGIWVFLLVSYSSVFSFYHILRETFKIEERNDTLLSSDRRVLSSVCLCVHIIG